MSGPPRSNPRHWAETLQWLNRADEDLRLAERIAADPDFLASAAFHCQQAAEKMAKAIIVAFQSNYPRVHDLAELAQVVSPLSPELGESIAGLSGLTDWYITSRYPGLEYHPSRQDVASALEQLRSLRREIDTLLPKSSA